MASHAMGYLTARAYLVLQRCYVQAQ